MTRFKNILFIHQLNLNNYFHPQLLIFQLIFLNLKSFYEKIIFIIKLVIFLFITIQVLFIINNYHFSHPIIFPLNLYEILLT